MTIEKKRENYIIESEPYVFAKPWHKQFPPMLVVSITNVCNLRCIHCYYSKFIKLPNYHPNMLPWDIWEKICEETSQWPGVILNFGTDGEPLLHPRFLEMLRLARRFSIYPINLTTNGLLMSAKLIKAVIQENLIDVVNVSIDAYNSETYKKIRGGNFDRVIRNVTNLIDERNRANSQMKIQANCIDQPESRGELEDFKKYWEPRVDNVMIRTYYDATSVTGETGSNITGKQLEFEQIKRWPCQQLWRRFNISDDGTVRFCVDDWFNKTKLGNLKVQSISEIWTGTTYNRLRHLHITGQYDLIPYCSKCTEWQGMKWDYDYFTAMKKMLNKDLL